MTQSPSSLAEPTVAALAATFTVEVKMVGVGSVGSRTENGREPAAGRPAQRVDEAGGRLAGRRLDALPSAVGEGEPGDIDRDAASVGTDPRTVHPVARATGEARTRAEGCQRSSDDAARQRHGRVTDELGKGDSERTAYHGPIRPFDLISIHQHAIEANGLLDPATGLRFGGRNGREGDADQRESRMAGG